MSMIEYIEKIKEIQTTLLSYIDDDKNIEENFQLLVQALKDQKIPDNRPELKLFLYFLSNVANNHNHRGDFFQKFEKILQTYQKQIEKSFTNTEIFDIFKGNKRILLFLIKSNIIKLDKVIVSKMTSNKYYLSKYPQYFYPEIKDFLNDQQQNQFNPNADDSFDEKRNNGENDEIVCELIRKDLLEEFTDHMNKTNLPLDFKIKSSIFETNSFLIENGWPTLIQYAAFFGSIQIFQHLKTEKAELTSSLWLYAIHGGNSEIIHQLEESHVDPPSKTKKEEESIEYEIDESENENDKNDKNVAKNKVEEINKDDANDESDDNNIINIYDNCLKESIICHHNDITNFFIKNYYQKKSHKIPFVCSLCLKYHNFAYLSKDSIKNSTFYDLCKYGYYKLVNFLLNEKEIDINKVRKGKAVVHEKLRIKKITDDQILKDPITMQVTKEIKIKETALNLAIKKQNLDIVELLLSNEKIDASIPNEILTIEKPRDDKLGSNEIKILNSAFCIAIETGNTEMIKFLLGSEEVDSSECQIKEDWHNWGPGPNKGKYTTEKPPLFIAFEKGNNDVIKLLLSNEKVDLNTPSKLTTKDSRNNNGVQETTLFNKFVEDGDIDNIKLLLETGRVDINAPNIENNSSRGKRQKAALQIAIDNKKNEIAKLLLQQESIDVDITDDKGTKLYESLNNTEIKQIIGDLLKARQEQFVIEPICTFAATGESFGHMYMFNCITCRLFGYNVCCEVCANRCHKGHDIRRFNGTSMAYAFCDCPGTGMCKCHKHGKLKCTGEVTKGKPVTQPMYQCPQCGISGDSYLCQSCAINHHHGHELTFTYKVKNKVCCNYHPT